MQLITQAARYQAMVSLYQISQCTTTMESINEILKVSRTLQHSTQTRGSAAGSRSHAQCFALLALEQSAGRGTTGRSWTSPVGNMHLSFALPQTYLKIDLAAVFPLLLGLSVRQAVTELFASMEKPIPNITLKWPNDVLCGHSKLSGTIVESMQGADDSYFVVGLGMNVFYKPKVPEGHRPATCLAEMVQAVDSQPPEVWLRSFLVPMESSSFQEVLTLQQLAMSCCMSILRTVGDYQDLPGEVGRQRVARDFASQMNFGMKLWKRCDDGSRGEEVSPVHLTEWGQLVVRNSLGIEEVLIASYLL